MARRYHKAKKGGCLKTLLIIFGFLLLIGIVGSNDSPTTTPTSTKKPPTATPWPLPTSSEASGLEVHFLNVGQGDSALVLCDGKAMLIDGGESAKSSLIYAYLKERDITHLDYIVATHVHSDHVGGLSGALNYATVDTALCPTEYYDSEEFSDFLKYLQTALTLPTESAFTHLRPHATEEEKEAAYKAEISVIKWRRANGRGLITVPEVGDVFHLGDAKFEIIAPLSISSNLNNNSLVIRLTYGNTSFLFTGDAESEAENEILASGKNISSTVLKVGHHGSDSSTTTAFLKRVSPKYAVIPVGYDNAYSFPNQETLDRLRQEGVKTYRTDLQGTIICKSNGQNVTFTTTKNAGIETLPTATPKATSTPRPTTAPNPVLKATQKPATEKKTTTYILNKNTKKFHYPSCGSVKQMKEKNKGSFTGTREEVIKKGYSPCGNCHP